MTAPDETDRSSKVEAYTVEITFRYLDDSEAASLRSRVNLTTATPKATSAHPS